MTWRSKRTWACFIETFWIETYLWEAHSPARIQRRKIFKTRKETKDPNKRIKSHLKKTWTKENTKIIEVRKERNIQELTKKWEDTLEIPLAIRENTIIAAGMGEIAKEAKNIGNVRWIHPTRNEDDKVVGTSGIEKVTDIQVTPRDINQAVMIAGTRKIPSLVQQSTMIDETELENAGTVKRAIKRETMIRARWMKTKVQRLLEKVEKRKKH